MKNWFTTFLGTKDKAQVERTEKVADYVHDQKNKFTKEMITIQKQASKIHEKARQSHAKSAKLILVVDDITMQIDKSTRI